MEDLEKVFWKKVRRYVSILRIVPFLRMVAVCNNLAFGKVDAKSDIDLFIVAKKGHLFTVRIFVTVLLQLMGVRRHGDKVSGRFCLSFFVDDSALDLSPIAIEDDVYLAFWIMTMKPVIDDGVFGEFLNRNDWALKYFAEACHVNLQPCTEYCLPESPFLKFFCGFLEFVFSGRFGNWVESIMRRWQLKRARTKASNAGCDADLLINDHVLKFHNVDRRRFYRDQWFVRYGESAKLTSDEFLSIIGDGE